MFGSKFLESGLRPSVLSGVGFFAAQALHIGSSATVIGSAGVAFTAGFIGGLVVYCPLVCLSLLLLSLNLDSDSYRFSIALLDTVAMVWAAPMIGALILGLPIAPFITCLTLGCGIFMVVHFFVEAIKSIVGGCANISIPTDTDAAVGTRFLPILTNR